VPLIGSKEGIGHVALCFVDPGDLVLVPNPGYPVYAVGTMFAGGEVYPLPLEEERGFLPVLDAIPSDVAQRTKVLWINYPNNPTGACAGLEFFERVVDFARRHDIIVCHDLAYADVAYDGYSPPSFLQVPGAKEVGIEFNSLSKTYNMTGWRVGMAVGNAAMVDALTRVKSNLDSGIPQAIQQMAIAAMQGPQDVIAEHNAIYTRRRDRVVEALRSIGLQVDPPKASLYVWARLPDGERSIDFAARLLDGTGVVVTPGIGYGERGEGYVRLSLTTPDDRVDEGLRRLASWSAAPAR
jgi:LL-diaminopimelate aminotransferase